MPAKNKSEEPQATDAAKEKAQDLGVDLKAVEPTGAQGQVKVEDVEAKLGEQQAKEETFVYALPNPDLVVNTGDVVMHDGQLYGERNSANERVVSERYFDEELAPQKISGIRVFVKGEVVVS